MRANTLAVVGCFGYVVGGFGIGVRGFWYVGKGVISF